MALNGSGGGLVRDAQRRPIHGVLGAIHGQFSTLSQEVRRGPFFKATGTKRDGRFDPDEGWVSVRMPPRFFVFPEQAYKYFTSMTDATLWVKNTEGSRNEWSVFLTKGKPWPEGARGSDENE
tara:strand:+ start:8853 stop:9218 length:366 start_codon:yes stop_codon:yes gene_type:complete